MRKQRNPYSGIMFIPMTLASVGAIHNAIGGTVGETAPVVRQWWVGFDAKKENGVVFSTVVGRDEPLTPENTGIAIVEGPFETQDEARKVAGLEP